MLTSPLLNKNVTSIYKVTIVVLLLALYSYCVVLLQVL